MQDIFVQSQWDTLMAFLRSGRPPTWQLLAIVNGVFLFYWVYLRFKGKTRLNPANLNLLRVLLVVLNAAVIWRDDTSRLLQPFISQFRHFFY